MSTPLVVFHTLGVPLLLSGSKDQCCADDLWNEEERREKRKRRRNKRRMENRILECVAGLKSKEEKFWKEIEDWEVVVMMETRIEERGREAIKKKLPKGYKEEKVMKKRKRREQEKEKEGDERRGEEKE
ncbi:protein MNN4-like [Nylanderia fulva]|uniref:protein MNN4-like n=1 Tax=Nylanderia fulva TaxID=613905 RepID=UPI0010FB84E5|nr:protein MNN4-like [Nylanderia fulva]